MVKTIVLALALVAVLCVSTLAAEPTESGVYDLTVTEGYTVTPNTEASTDEITISGGVVDNFFPAAEKFTLSYTAENTTDQHMVFALSGDGAVPTEDNLVYIDQTTADAANTVSFTVYPSELVSGETYHIYVVGTNLAKTEVASFSYYEAAETAAVAEVGGVGYETLASAITAAGSGGTVKLLANVEATTVSLKSGVTLDLSGKTLTCSYLVSFADSQIIDSSAGKSGAVKCTKNGLSVSADNAQMPIWNGTDGYFFESFNVINTGGSGSNGTYTFIFRPEFVTDEREALIGTNGGELSGFSIKVLLTWDETDGSTGERSLVYKDEFVKQVYGENKAFYAYITNYENYVAKNLQIRVAVVSDFGIEIASAATSVG